MALDAESYEMPSHRGTVRFSSTDAAAQLPPDAALSDGTGSFRVTFALREPNAEIFGQAEVEVVQEGRETGPSRAAGLAATA